MPSRLDRPPIVEALLDFRLDTDDADAATERLDDFASAISGQYPDEVNLPHLEDMPAAVQALIAASDARRLRSSDGARTVIAGSSRVTFSIKFDWPERVYTSWVEELVSPAFEVWGAYQDHVQPRALVSLATRFVNRLRVHPDRLGEVLSDPPSSPTTGLSLSSFSDHRAGRTEDGFGARIGRRLGSHGQDSARSALFLDVEAFITYDDAPKPTPITQDHLADDLARLDAIKNELFFASLTEPALNSYRDDDA